MQHSLESVGCAKASVIQLCCMLYVVDSIAHVAGLKGIGACDMNSKQNNQWVIGCQAANDRNKPPRLLKALVSFISTSMSSHSPNLFKLLQFHTDLCNIQAVEHKQHAFCRPVKPHFPANIEWCTAWHH